ncbi:MAG: polysaccharide lyase family 4 protein [Bacteroidota bacterium]|nr:polysaccharide lyase family 4 protein [Bacteroidota bacterium]
MDITRSILFRGIIFLSLIFISLFAPLATYSDNTPVTVKEDAETFTLDNGIVTARVSKVTGDLVSLRYKNVEMLATTLLPDFKPVAQGDSPANNPNWRNPSITGHQHGYWSHDAMGAKGSAPALPSITIDPKSNGGERAEVSVRAISNGRKMGTGPGSTPEGQFVSDIEIRYTLGRGEPGIYTYCFFEHKPEYSLTELGEARFCAKLAPFFDWMSVDARRDFLYPKDLHVGDKYIYTALQSANPAFGWSSTTKNVGLFIINPSMEYLSGGPTKVEFLGHRDTNAEAAGCVLNYWRSSHYGGAEVNVAAGEEWKKVVGPFFIYMNAGANHTEIYADARTRAAIEARKWPYSWVKGVDYPLDAKRTTVKGQLVLNDPITGKKFTNLMVGLTAPAYVSPRLQNPPVPVITDWQRDGKFYQFWNGGKADGSFELTKVRPGHYTLHAMADGVLGEYIVKDVVVEAGKPLNLGKMTWTPLRHGRQLWDIGIPNRSSSEFYGAEKHDDPEISIEYATLFPQDVNYTIGKSDFRKDWFFQHVPHNENPAAKSTPFFGVSSPGRATPFTVIFNMPSAPKGKATLRLAICGTGSRTLEVSVNGKPAGKIDKLTGDGVITRHGLQGLWYEREIAFDAGLMQAGTNKLVLSVPAGPINNGIMYDYLRLELEE